MQELVDGLMFYSNYEKPGSASKLVLPEKGEFSINKPFSISFEFSINPKSHYGVMLQARDGKEPIFTVSYIDFQSKDSSFINLVYEDKDTGIRLPILKNELDLNNWMLLILEIDPISNSVKLTLNTQSIETLNIDIVNDFSFKLVFGKPINRNDVPSMGIRNVKLIINGVEKNNWPLNEFRSKKVSDIVGNMDGFQRDCLWINSRHQNWTLINSISKSEIEFVDFTLGRFNTIINLDNKLTGIITDGNNVKLEFLNIKPLPEKFIHFFDNKCLLSYHAGGEGPISVYDNRTRQWSNIDITQSNDQYYNGAMLKDVRGDIYLLGGYGNYSVKNQLMKYDWITAQGQVQKVL